MHSNELSNRRNRSNSSGIAINNPTAGNSNTTTDSINNVFIDNGEEKTVIGDRLFEPATVASLNKTLRDATDRIDSYINPSVPFRARC